MNDNSDSSDSSNKNIKNKTSEREWEIDNLPNRLTVFRITLVPIVIASLLLSLPATPWIDEKKNILGHIAAWTFIIASITDYFDGVIARKRNIVTVFGSFLDPIADKILVVSSIIMLQALGRIHPVIVVILIVRELYMTSLRLLALEKGLTIPVNQLGKWKTATQMVGIPLLMFNHDILGIPVHKIGNICIYLASILSVYSAIVYSLNLLKKFRTKRLMLKRSAKIST